MCRYLRQYTRCVIEDCEFSWDDDEPSSCPNIFGCTVNTNTIGECIRHQDIAAVYMCHNVVEQVIKDLPICPVLSIMYNRSHAHNQHMD